MTEENVQTTQNNESEKKWQKYLNIHITWDMLVKNVPFILYLAILSVFYITNNSLAADLVRETESINKELKELKWQYLDVQSRLIKATSEEELLKVSSQYGLKPMEKPAFEIKEIIEIVNK